VWGQGVAGRCQQTFENKKFVDNAQQCFAFAPQANFPAHNLNFFYEGEGDGIEFRLPFKIFSTLHTLLLQTHLKHSYTRSEIRF